MKRLHLSHGAVAIGTFFKTDFPQVMEVLAISALDFQWSTRSARHLNRQSLDRMLLGGRAAGLSLMMRMPDFSPASIQTALDLDAADILVPRVGSSKHARLVVSRARFRNSVRGLSVAARFWGYGTLPETGHIARAGGCTAMKQMAFVRSNCDE